MTVKPLTSEQIRKRLNLSVAEWARALNVTQRTVQRWEEGGDCNGLASEVLLAISSALADGTDPGHVARQIRMGIGPLLFFGLTFPTRKS